MSRLHRAAVAGVAVGAIVLVIAAWQQDRPELSAADARSFTEHALDHLGFEAIEVAPKAPAATYQPQSGGGPIRVWQTTATVRGGRVEILVQRDAGVAVFVEDRTTDGTRQLLTADQFRVLAEYEHDPPLDARLRRNVIATIAGMLLAGVAVAAIMIAGMRQGATR